MTDKNKNVILSIDQGTTSSRTLVFTAEGELLHTAQKAFAQIYPNDGWVEHDPEAIWDSVLDTLKDAAEFCRSKELTPAAIAITNQRETTIVWDRKTGAPIYNAIVWQDRRTAKYCEGLKSRGLEPMVKEKTGLLLDPYFSASKIAWILDNVEGAKSRAEKGELAFGTIDSFLIWRLTGGSFHATDATNASRTSLFNIKTNQWDRELTECFDVPQNILPEVKDCADDYGVIDSSFGLGPIPISGVAGDQQAALIGQRCFAKGEMKSTYGTGCFIVANTGDQILKSENKLLSTIAYRLDGKTTYALEGSIFVAGAAVQWLRDTMELFADSKETGELAQSAENNPDLYFVPALAGLGAPHWNPHARGAIFGLTRAATRADFVRAALEGISFQTHDLLEAMRKDGVSPSALRIDGGMAANIWFVQALSNLTDTAVDVPKLLETTALGAARLAALQIGLISAKEFKSAGQNDFAKTRPKMTKKRRKQRLIAWNKAIKATIAFSEGFSS